MRTAAHTLKELFEQALSKAFPELEGAQVEIRQASQESFGHYQFNSSMRLAKALKKPPREVASAILERVEKKEIIDTLEIAGPGFINITLKTTYLEHFLEQLLKGPKLGVEPPASIDRIVIDFSSPNTAKEMHVGHLRSTIIGDCLARVLEFLGHDVLRLNHVGDWGTAFGMLIAHMKERAPRVLEGAEETDLSHLVSWYRQSKERFDLDPDFRKRAQEEVVLLQGGEPEALKAWGIICEISRRAYREIYDLLEIRIHERGESYYNETLPEVVSDLEEKGLVELSEGAKCIYLEGFKNREGEPLPLMIQKSDGGYNYATTDMAALKQRIEEEKATRIIYVTDAGQATHFQMIFAAAQKASYLDRTRVRVDHVPFGLVLGPDGKKFRTRSGETERLIDLIRNAISKADEILREKNPEMEREEREGLARAIGVGSIKYADLSCNRTSDYLFSYDKMLRFEGNTAAFLLYAYVRVAGIKRKCNAEIDLLKQTAQIKLEHPSEISLALHLAQLGEALEKVAEELLPNRLTDYLYILAEKFHAFFRDCRVIGSERRDERLLLCEAAALAMKEGLNLLGLQTVERM